MKITVDVTPKQVLESASQLERADLEHALGMPHWAGHAEMVRGLARAAVLLEQREQQERLPDSGIWDDEARKALERARSVGLVPPRGPVIDRSPVECDVRTCSRHEAPARARHGWQNVPDAKIVIKLADNDDAVLKAMNAAAELAALKTSLSSERTKCAELLKTLAAAEVAELKARAEIAELKARIELLTNADAER